MSTAKLINDILNSIESLIHNLQKLINIIHKKLKRKRKRKNNTTL